MDACDYLLRDLEASYELQCSEDPTLYRGMRFARAEDLKVAVEQFYASQGKGVKLGQGGSRQREFRCSGSRIIEGTREHVGCPAVIRATKQANSDWKISSMDTLHKNCTGFKGKVSLTTAERIASRIIATVPNITEMALKSAIENQTGGTLTLRSARRAKRAALAGRRVALTESHSRLRSFLFKFAAKYPGTITDLEVRAERGYFE